MTLTPAAPRVDAERLPTLALSRPSVALRQARDLLALAPDDLAASYAHQAAGIVLRGSGQLSSALVHLRHALRAAERSGVAARVTDVRATHGVALVMAGRTQQGLDELAWAAQHARGPLAAQVRLRRAAVLHGIGRHVEALVDVRAALTGSRAAGDQLLEARALQARAVVHQAQGALSGAEEDLTRAGALFAQLGQDLELAATVHNRGVIAFCAGDIPGTLRLYDQAAAAYEALGDAAPDLVVDRGQALLAAGLASEALAVSEHALGDTDISPFARAELELGAATAALADGDLTSAQSRGGRARNLFRKQQRDWWQARAELIVIRARRLRGESGPALVVAAGELAHRLVDLRADDAPVALVIAGKLAAVREPVQARAHFLAATHYRRSPSALTRATGWLATALAREIDDDRRGVLVACGRGLAALDEHRATLGSSELRALATAHGSELADLALRHAARSGGARRLLSWSERWRATSLVEPPVRPPRAGAVADDLVLLRTRVQLIDEARRDGRSTEALVRGRAAAERAVREHRHQLAGVRRTARVRFDVGELVAELGGTTFVELVVVDETLHAVTVRNGRVRTQAVGPLDAAEEALTAARFVLRQIGRGRPGDLSGLGDRLERTLLGRVLPGDGPVVIAPPGRLHAAPWALIPSLGDRAISVVPSAAMWLRARATRPPETPRLVLVAGPGLGTGGAEVDHLARTSPGALLLRDGRATVDATLTALDGASLAHVAAHGHFRADSPMFSSLALDDGPLTVHDLETLDRAPYRLVLSACDSGVMAPVGADELLGLSAALLSLGTAGVVCSVAEVNDEATVDVMLAVHREIENGAGLAEALLAARRDAGDDALRRASAASFVALGA